MILDGIEAVIFDFEGTLYDPKNIEKEMVKNLFFQLNKYLGLKKINAEFTEKYFNSEEDFKKSYFSALGKQFKCSEKEAENWYDRVYIKTFLEVLGKKFLCRKNLNCVYSVLKHKKIKIAICGDLSVVKAEMETLGIYEKFADCVFSAQKLGGSKANPEIFKKVAAELDVKPEKILVVGDDNKTDGEGARKCGMKFIQIRNKNTKEKESEVNHPIMLWYDFCEEIGI